MSDNDPSNSDSPQPSSSKDTQSNDAGPSTSQNNACLMGIRANSIKKKPKTSGFRKKSRSKQKDSSLQKKKIASWSLSKLNCSFKRLSNVNIAEPTSACSSCVCTEYRRTEDHHLGAGIVFKSSSASTSFISSNLWNSDLEKQDGVESEPIIDLSKFNPDDYPIEDCDERARRERAREIEEGVDPPPGYNPKVVSKSDDVTDLAKSVNCVSIGQVSREEKPCVNNVEQMNNQQVQLDMFPSNVINPRCSSNQIINQQIFEKAFTPHSIHSQVDYIHCLVPDILNITRCSFYWGKIDQYEAERLLDNKAEGTFLLRDSAQEDYLFSVSFRRYGRSLHARIEQWNHKFSFDVHDPGVFASSTVCGLIEHYKDPSRCMFFEPMLTIPFHRSFVFSLQHLCQSTISNNITYDGINRLPLPKLLKAYLKEYHYKQRVRVRSYDVEH